jgi:hypothetical protein
MTRLLIAFSLLLVLSDLSLAAEPLNIGSRRELFVDQTLIERLDGRAELRLHHPTRDGLTFRRWDEAFLRPGPQPEGRWIYGDNYQSYGLFETRSETAGAPNELSLHFNEGSWRDSEHRLRRYTIRLDGFVSLHAPLAGGELTTKPLKFTGRRLSLNYATSAAGSLRLEIQDAEGKPIPGFSLTDADELYGDSCDQSAAWRDSTDVSRLAEKVVRLHFVLRDADLFSFQFTD